MVMGQNLSMMLVHTYTIFRGSIPISPNYFRVYLLTPTGTNWLTPIWVTSEHFAKHQPTFLVRLAASKGKGNGSKWQDHSIQGALNSRRDAFVDPSRVCNCIPAWSLTSIYLQLSPIWTSDQQNRRTFFLIHRIELSTWQPDPLSLCRNREAAWASVAAWLLICFVAGFLLRP